MTRHNNMNIRIGMSTSSILLCKGLHTQKDACRRDLPILIDKVWLFCALLPNYSGNTAATSMIWIMVWKWISNKLN